MKKIMLVTLLRSLKKTKAAIKIITDEANKEKNKFTLEINILF